MSKQNNTSTTVPKPEAAMPNNVGIGIGFGLLGFLLLAAIVFACFLYRRLMKSAVVNRRITNLFSIRSSNVKSLTEAHAVIPITTTSNPAFTPEDQAKSSSRPPPAAFSSLEAVSVEKPGPSPKKKVSNVESSSYLDMGKATAPYAYENAIREPEEPTYENLKPESEEPLYINITPSQTPEPRLSPRSQTPAKREDSDDDYVVIDKSKEENDDIYEEVPEFGPQLAWN